MYHFDDWQKHWTENNVPWTGEQVNAVLVQQLPRLILNFGLTSGSRVLVPLAGDSPAVKLLYDAGMDVTAVEYVPEAAKRLAAQFGLTSDSNAYVGDRIRILVQDIFEFNEKQRYEFVYDRAAYVALAKHERPKYADIIRESLAPGGLLLMRTSELIGGEWKGPPHSIAEAEVKTAYSELELLEREEDTIPATREDFVAAGVKEIKNLNCLFRKSKK